MLHVFDEEIVSKSITKPVECGGILGHFRVCWRHENAMMLIDYRLMFLCCIPQIGVLIHARRAGDFWGLRTILGTLVSVKILLFLSVENSIEKMKKLDKRNCLV